MTDQHGKGGRAQRDGETEQRILHAAARVFVRRGTSGARMQEIAEEADVNPALLHYYFRSKDGLAIAVFRQAASRLIPSVAAVLGSDATLEEKVEGFVHLYIDTVRKNPFIPGYIVSELHHHPERVTELMSETLGDRTATVAGRFVAKIRAQLDESARAGRTRPMSPEQFLANLLALSVFPFVARPLLGVLLDLDDTRFGEFLDARRAELPAFIMRGLRP